MSQRRGVTLSQRGSLAASQQQQAKRSEPVTLDDIIKAFQEDKKFKEFKHLANDGRDESAEFIAKCLSLCVTFEKSLVQLMEDMDAFRWAEKVKARVLSLADMDRLAARMHRQAEEDRKAELKRTSAKLLLQPRAAALVRPSQPVSRSFDKGSLSAVLATEDLDDMFGDDVPASAKQPSVKLEPVSPAKAKRKASELDGEDNEEEQEEEHKSGETGSARKRAHLADGESPMDTVAEEDSAALSASAATPASTGSSLPASRSSRPSFSILSDGSGQRMQALYPNALGKFVQRTNAGETAVAFNEQQLARLEASSSEPSAEEQVEIEKRIIEIELLSATDAGADDAEAAAAAAAFAAASTAATPAAASATPLSKSKAAAAKYAKGNSAGKTGGARDSATGSIDTSLFRYMYQNEDELREALDANLVENQQIMMEKPEVEAMRQVIRGGPGAGTTSLAKSLVTKTPAATAAVVAVKKEPVEEKKDEAAAATSTPPAADETASSAPSATPAASADASASTPAASSDSADATAGSASSPAASAAAAASTPASTSSSSAAAAAAPIVINDDEEDEAAQANIVPLVSVAQSKSQQSVLLFGRVVYDAHDPQIEGELIQKLSATHSVTIEGDKDLSGGARIQMRLNGLRQYALFPGQSVLARGINASGMSFVAEDVFTDASLPHASLARTRVERLNASLGFRPLGLMVAAGPFTTSEDLSFAPLFALLAEVVRVRPDVLLLLGPFVDSEHKDLADNFRTVTASYAQLFVRLLGDIMAHVRGIKIRVLVVPSTRDMAAVSIFPQPPFDLAAAGASATLMSEVSAGRLVLLPNPVMFRLNDLTIGCSSMDILSHLGANNEISKAPPVPPVVLGSKASATEPLGRLQRLGSHLINSHSFYPLFPAPDGVFLDYTHSDALRMSSTPDILILPSKTRYFASAVRGDRTVNPGAGPADANDPSSTATESKLPTLIVNPEFITKGPSGGTYGLITIHPLKEEEMVAPANSHDRLRDHCILSRTRVDILRI